MNELVILSSFLVFVTQPVKLITMDKFERVCAELNDALKREQVAQQILNEQSRQLQELTMRLDLSDTQGAQKQQTLSEAMTVSTRDSERTDPVQSHDGEYKRLRNNRPCLRP